jgi:hypothetical protein
MTINLTLTNEEAACIRQALADLEKACRKGGNGIAAMTAQAIRHRVIAAQDAAYKSGR